jgi:hypothetical protein
MNRREVADDDDRLMLVTKYRDVLRCDRFADKEDS